jgi:hypothetical protein
MVRCREKQYEAVSGENRPASTLRGRERSESRAMGDRSAVYSLRTQAYSPRHSVASRERIRREHRRPQREYNRIRGIAANTESGTPRATQWLRVVFEVLHPLIEVFKPGIML